MSTFAFDLVRGDTAAKQLTIRQVASPQTAIDLTGLTVTIAGDTQKNPTDETTQLFKKTMTVTSASDGQAEFELAVGDWSGIDPGNYWFDIQSVDAGSAIQTLVKGQFRIIQDINKD